ncbi:MAG: type I methionyl aminopeptidase [Eubacteriales bacterium]
MDLISMKSPEQLTRMRKACRLAAGARALAGSMVAPGVTTREIDQAVHRYLKKHGAKPSFLGYAGFPASICISINEELIHGIPSGRKLNEGEIVSIDVGAYIGGFHGDCAATFPVGEISDEAKRLIKVTEQSFWEGMKFAKVGYRLGDLSHAIGSYIESEGYSVVRDYVGHGVGAKLHEPPEVRNFGEPGHGVRLAAGMTLAVEPMVNQGDYKIKVLGDQWTVVTADGKLCAHYENSILITQDEVEILTVTEEDHG